MTIETMHVRDRELLQALLREIMRRQHTKPDTPDRALADRRVREAIDAITRRQQLTKLGQTLDRLATRKIS